MEIGEAIDFAQFIDAPRSGLCILFSERSGSPFSAIDPGKKITAVIGPEGGWEDSEIETARGSGFVITTLGGRILRAETAAISIAAILQHRFGDLS